MYGPQAHDTVLDMPNTGLAKIYYMGLADWKLW